MINLIKFNSLKTELPNSTATLNTWCDGSLITWLWRIFHLFFLLLPHLSYWLRYFLGILYLSSKISSIALIWLPCILMIYFGFLGVIMISISLMATELAHLCCKYEVSSSKSRRYISRPVMVVYFLLLSFYAMISTIGGGPLANLTLSFSMTNWVASIRVIVWHVLRFVLRFLKMNSFFTSL